MIVPFPGSGLLAHAIREKRLISYSAGGFDRIAEPHLVGRHRGLPQVLVYQVGGGSQSGNLPHWRRHNVAELSNIRMLDGTFLGARVFEHRDWDEIWVKVD